MIREIREKSEILHEDAKTLALQTYRKGYKRIYGAELNIGESKVKPDTYLPGILLPTKNQKTQKIFLTVNSL